MTEVFVSLDYPLKDSHWDGYKKILDYFQSCGDLGFKKLTLIKRSKNLGFGAKGNLRTTRNELFKKYDRLILSEDDNVFSPDFLDYMNKCLEIYEHDDNVNFVCGYNYNTSFNDLPHNHYFSNEFSAWGMGEWKNKTLRLDYIETKEYLEKILFDRTNLSVIYKNEPRLINTLIMLYQTDQIFGDTMKVCYQYLTGSLSVFPKISTVRNLGFDGTGTTINKVIPGFDSQIIDTEDSIDIKRRQPEIDLNAMGIVKKHWSRPGWMNLLIYIRMYIHLWTRLDVFSMLSKIYNKGNTKMNA